MTVLSCVLYSFVFLLTDVTLRVALESQSVCCIMVAKQQNSEGHRSPIMIKTLTVAYHSYENKGVQTTSRRKKLMLSIVCSFQSSGIFISLSLSEAVTARGFKPSRIFCLHACWPFHLLLIRPTILLSGREFSFTGLGVRSSFILNECYVHIFINPSNIIYIVYNCFLIHLFYGHII